MLSKKTSKKALQKFVVVALGFERVCFSKLTSSVSKLLRGNEENMSSILASKIED
jgi:hypothetical protein